MLDTQWRSDLASDIEAFIKLAKRYKFKEAQAILGKIMEKLNG
jgi:hypothetical protein